MAAASKPPIYFPLSQAQTAFIDAAERIRGFVGGRGAGKSHVGAYDLLRRVEPGRLYMVVAPTYPMLRDASFRSFRTIAQKLGQWRAWHRTEFIVTVSTWKGGTAEILFRSGDDPDRLRGPNLSGIWLDEASLMSREVYEVVLACLREAGESGWLSATFTPKGRSHWSYEVFGKSNPGVSLTHSSTADNPFVSEEFLDTVRAQYGSLRALQELEGQFVDIEGAEWPADLFGPDIWFDEWPRDLTLRVIALDPSKGGREAKFGDYSAFVSLGRARDGLLYVEADMDNRRSTTQIVQEGLELCRYFRPDGFAVEANQFQEMLATEFVTEGQRRAIAPPVYPVTNTVNKQVRIRRLTPYLSRGLLRFRGGHRGTELLVQQLRDFPCGDHDDGPDALEMALRLASQLVGGPKETPEATVLRV